MTLDNFFLKNIQVFASEMQIMYELQMECLGKEHLVANMVNHTVTNNIPSSKLLAELKEMAGDDSNVLSSMIGRELTVKILNHGPQQ